MSRQFMNMAQLIYSLVFKRYAKICIPLDFTNMANRAARRGK